MKKNMGEKGRKLMDAIKADKKITLIVCIGLLGMLLFSLTFKLCVPQSLSICRKSRRRKHLPKTYRQNIAMRKILKNG